MSNIKRILIPEEKILQEIKKTAQKINNIYDGRSILLIGILNGSFMFFSDLCKEITVPCEVGFMQVKSYSGTESTGNVDIVLDVKQKLEDYHVVIVEDIVDTGRTLKEVTEKLKQRNPISLTVVALLDKPDRRVVDFKADLALFTIPDLFVIGYGLDCNEKYRNLRYIAEYET